MLKIDPELKEWIDPLSDDEYRLLEESILSEGCRDPIVTWEGWILDGHNRYDICTKHGLAYQTVEKSGLKTKDDVKIWMIQNQIGRRNGTDFQRAAWALKLKPLLEKKAKARIEAGQFKEGGAASQKSDEPQMRTDEAIAKVAGVSRDTIRKVEKITEKADAETLKKVRSGEISINSAAKTITPPKSVKAEPAPEVRNRTSEPAEYYGPSAEEVEESVKAQEEEIAAMRLVFDADDRLAAAMAEIKRLQGLLRISESQKDGLQNNLNQQIGRVKYLQRKLAEYEKAAA